jgi:hypothetical protein
VQPYAKTACDGAVPGDRPQQLPGPPDHACLLA